MFTFISNLMYFLLEVRKGRQKAINLKLVSKLPITIGRLSGKVREERLNLVGEVTFQSIFEQQLSVLF